MSTLITQAPLNDTQQRILDAAIACMKKWGLEKTNLNDIAKMAGVTRPTVYSYFGSRDQVISAALMRAAIAFGQRLIEHFNRFDNPEDRYIESLLFSLKELPKEPYLEVITRNDLSPLVNNDALMNESGWALSLALFREIFKGRTWDDEELFEISEVTIRLLLSLLVTKGPRQRTEEELRGFLRRRLLPMIAASNQPARRSAKGASRIRLAKG